MAGEPRRPLVAGNWKMNGLMTSVSEVSKIAAGARDLAQRVELLVCPPATLIAAFAVTVRGSPLRIGGQDCHSEARGAFTGDLAAEMLKDAGASAVIVGHSERRRYHDENDTDVRAKTMAAMRAGLMTIVCIGETRAEREAGATLSRIEQQFHDSLPVAADEKSLVIAYEPVWAIGTGLIPTTADVAEVHGFLRKQLVTRYRSAGEAIRILYGGSVKPVNAKELLGTANVDGALVGGASLKAEDFLGIAATYG
ncbi:MAG: triose-phosphate isomerase [Rhizobiales bacterium]|nr:triose-phosphate isomerase [Hyphomicrobiales bacterium]